MKTKREILLWGETLFIDKSSDLNLENMLNKIRKNGLRSYYKTIINKKDKYANQIVMIDKIFSNENLTKDLNEKYMEKIFIICRYLEILAKKFSGKSIETIAVKDLSCVECSNDKYDKESCNIGLKLDKFTTEIIQNEISIKFNNVKNENENNRWKALDELKDKQYQIELKNKADTYDKIQENLINYRNIACCTTLVDRMVIGIGDSDIKETSIKLDHVTGIPYIPASTIKGAFRSFMEDYLTDEGEQEEAELIEVLFGNDTNSENAIKGNLIFFDSYPTEDGFTIDIDVMAKHYYNSSEWPRDNEKINLIKFYVVRDVEFDFRVYAAIEFSDEQKNIIDTRFGQADLEKIWELFISNEAFGAKKAVGYGKFEIGGK